MTMFSEKQKVVTPKGVGVVVYADDSYLSVELPNGVEVDFSAPFKGVTTYIETKPKLVIGEIPEQDALQILIAIAELGLPAGAILAIAIEMHQIIARTVNRIGSAAPWADLTAVQKLHFLGVVSGVNPQQWLLHLRVGTLEVAALVATTNAALALEQSK